MYRRSVIHLSNGFTDSFVANPAMVKKMMANSTAIRTFALSAYEYTVKAGEIEPIELLSEDGKNKLWDESLTYSKHPEIRKKWCKIIWMMMSVTV